VLIADSGVLGYFNIKNLNELRKCGVLGYFIIYETPTPKQLFFALFVTPMELIFSFRILYYIFLAFAKAVVWDTSILKT
jgi:hypothetical protein